VFKMIVTVLEDWMRVRLSRPELRMLKIKGTTLPLASCWNTLLRLPSDRLGVTTIDTFVILS
jgi:hypothetical protein